MPAFKTEIPSPKLDTVVTSNESEDTMEDIKIEEKKVINEELYLSISLSQLLEKKLIHIGDKLVLIREDIYIGQILNNGNIKSIVNSKYFDNLSSFTESCGVKYSQDCMDMIYCNGKKLRDYMDLYCNQNINQIIINDKLNDLEDELEMNFFVFEDLDFLNKNMNMNDIYDDGVVVGNVKVSYEPCFNFVVEDNFNFGQMFYEHGHVIDF